MKKYRIVRTAKADEMLSRIVMFIANQFGAEVALERLDLIEKQINLLATQPEMGMIPKYDVLRRQGYRVLILEKDLVFYKVDQSARLITVYAVFDARQNYLEILRGL